MPRIMTALDVLLQLLLSALVVWIFIGRVVPWQCLLLGGFAVLILFRRASRNLFTYPPDTNRRTVQPKAIQGDQTMADQKKYPFELKLTPEVTNILSRWYSDSDIEEKALEKEEKQ